MCQVSCRPDFACPIYGGLMPDSQYIKGHDYPPMFFGGLDEKNKIYQALLKAGVPVARCDAIHNSGVRPVDQRYDGSTRCAQWLKAQGCLKSSPAR